jgi:hypothetical protein
LADEIERLSCAAFELFEPCRATGLLAVGRVVCRQGSAAVEEIRLGADGEWELRSVAFGYDEYLLFWKELLTFDLWGLPEEIAVTECRGGTYATYCVGDKHRRVWCGGIWASEFRYPDEPVTWIGALVKERLKGNAAVSSGKMASPVKFLDSLRDAWLRGEPWEEIVKKFSREETPKER